MQFGAETIDVVYRKFAKGGMGMHYDPYAPGTSVEDGIRYERDLPVKLRDAVTIYVDVYRPEDAVDVSGNHLLEPLRQATLLRRPTRLPSSRGAAGNDL